VAAFTVNRRDTNVIPNNVVLGNKVNNVLNYLFITWSVLVIIMYFVGVSIPNYVEIIVSSIAIGIAVLHQIYTRLEYRRSGVHKIGITPNTTNKGNLDLTDLNKIIVTN
jgi:hypothetical protein